MSGPETIVPLTRQATGVGFLHYAYAYDRSRAKIVSSCRHRHRRYATALRCATALVRKYVAAQEARP